MLFNQIFELLLLLLSLSSPLFSLISFEIVHCSTLLAITTTTTTDAKTVATFVNQVIEEKSKIFQNNSINSNNNNNRNNHDFNLKNNNNKRIKRNHHSYSMMMMGNFPMNEQPTDDDDDEQIQYSHKHQQKQHQHVQHRRQSPINTGRLLNNNNHNNNHNNNNNNNNRIKHGRHRNNHHHHHHYYYHHHRKQNRPLPPPGPQPNINLLNNQSNNIDGNYKIIDDQSSTSSNANDIQSCDQWFSSEFNPNGTFTSPNYPEPYPAKLRCNYHFVGHGKERVQVIFLDFDVHKVEDQHRNCEISDSLTAYIVTNGQKEWIDDFCGQELPPRIMSNGHRLTFEFKSLDHNRQPYKRFYKKLNYPTQPQSLFMIADNDDHSSANNNNNNNNYHEQSLQYHDDNQQFMATSFNINSSNNDSKLSHINTKHRKKHKKQKSNRLDDKENDDASLVTNRMMNDQGVRKKLKSKNVNTNSNTNNNNNNNDVDQYGRQMDRYHSRGFKASFRFVTNFGIETGRQDSKSVCGFVYNSTESKNGYFTSPNYPGLYPKDTECHYFFYGNMSEKVFINFIHFDVEGVTPCTLETASDYVEFSNVYMSNNRVYRHCGLKHPKSIQSDGDFFRITFKSNGRFDGTGFKANYEFRHMPTSQSSIDDLYDNNNNHNDNYKNKNDNSNNNNNKNGDNQQQQHKQNGNHQRTIKTMKTLSSSGSSSKLFETSSLVASLIAIKITIIIMIIQRNYILIIE